MPKTNPRPGGYEGAASTALVMIVAACDLIKDKDQRSDMIEAAGRLLWYAARASTFSIVKSKCPNLLHSKDHTDEILALSRAALSTINKLNEAADKCRTLAELFLEKEGEAND